MDLSSEDVGYEGSDSTEENLAQEDQKYRVQLSSASYTEMGFSNKKEVNKKSQVSYTAHDSIRVKRVVSCKRKTRHLSVSSGVRRRPSINAKTFEAFNKGSEQAGKAEMLDGGYGESCLRVSQNSRTEQETIRYCDFFSQISWDHKQMTEILFGRNLKLNIALTLWRRNVGELLSFLIKIQDLSVLLDCLSVFTKSLQNQCARVSAGFCVDLFPLVENVLRSHYEDYLVIALLWIQAVLMKWLPQLAGLRSGELGPFSNDYKNIHAIKQKLQGLRRMERQLHFTTEATTEIWKTIESQLYHL